MKYDSIGQVDNDKLHEVINVLELGIGECEATIPSVVLQDAVDYLKLLSYERSWYGCGEDMGR